MILVARALGRAADAVRAPGRDAAVHAAWSPPGALMSLDSARTPADDGARRRLRLVVVQVARVLAVRHPLRPALLPPGRLAATPTTRRPPRSRCARSSSSPQRGLIVDDQGRPAGRQPHRRGWSRSTARCSTSCPTTTARSLLQPRGRRGRTCRCGRIQQRAGHLRRRRAACAARCWNGSPYQPVPVAARRPPVGGAADPRAARGLPGASSPSSRACAPTRARTASTSPHVLGYLSPITAGRARRRPRRTTTPRSTAPRSVGRAGVEKEYDRYLRGMPGYQRVAVDSMGRVLGDDGRGPRPARRHPGHLHRRQGAGASSSGSSRRRDHAPRARPTTRSPHRNYRADSGAAIVLEAQAPAGSSRWPASRRTTRRCGSAASPASSWPGSTPTKAGDPAARPGHPGPVRARLDVEADHDRRRAQPRLHARAPGSTARRASRSATGSFKNYESESLRDDRLRQGAAALLRHVLLPRRLPLLAEVRLRPDERRTPRTRWSHEAKAFGFGRATGIDLPGEAAGRIADRHWKLAYWKSMKGYYCGIDQQPPAGTSDFLHAVRPRVLPRGQLLPRR